MGSQQSRRKFIRSSEARSRSSDLGASQFKSYDDPFVDGPGNTAESETAEHAFPAHVSIRPPPDTNSERPGLNGLCSAVSSERNGAPKQRDDDARAVAIWSDEDAGDEPYVTVLIAGALRQQTAATG